MTRLPRLISARTTSLRRDDAGATMLELMIASGIFLLLSAIVVMSMQTLIGQVSRVRGKTASTKQAQRAFLRFDHQIRYAAAVNRPVKVGDDWYVELMTTASGASQCAQWRLVAATDVLESRTWTVSGTTASGLTVWMRAADKMVNDPAKVAEKPFVFTQAGSPASRQSLNIHLLAGDGSNRTETLARLIARNTTPETSTNADANNDGVSDTQICQEAGRA